MDNVLLAVVGFLAFIILFTLAVRYGAVFAGRIMGRKVYATHHAMETILDTEKIPPEWIEPLPREPAQACAMAGIDKSVVRSRSWQNSTSMRKIPGFRGR